MSLEKTSEAEIFSITVPSILYNFWISFSSGLYWHTLPVHHLPRLWSHVPCVHHAAIHAQQPPAGKTLWAPWPKPHTCSCFLRPGFAVHSWEIHPCLSFPCHPKPFKVCLWLLVKASAVFPGRKPQQEFIKWKLMTCVALFIWSLFPLLFSLSCFYSLCSPCLGSFALSLPLILSLDQGWVGFSRETFSLLFFPLL